MGCLLMAKKKKIRADFRKKHDARRRESDLTRKFHENDQADDDLVNSERVSGKGRLTRKRTIMGDESTDENSGFAVHLDVDEAAGKMGRVLSVHGLNSIVHTETGEYRCATRGLLKSLSTDQRHVVAAGDRVFIRTIDDETGVIERIEPRTGVISRTSKKRQHVIVANVDQLLIIGSAAEPSLKPNLIDRFLITAEKNGIEPVICINKCDLVDLADLQPLVGVYSQMGYQVLLVSAQTGFNVDRLRQMIGGKQSVVAGQSGVGKSSLLNAIQPDLALAVKSVSQENQKGRHTTTAAKLIALGNNGFIVDTPGIRQFQLWDVIAEEIAGYFRDLRPFQNHCRFPDCSHTHEAECAVKDAVADGHLDARRYESYCHLLAGDMI